MKYQQQLNLNDNIDSMFVTELKRLGLRIVAGRNFAILFGKG